MYLCNFSFVIIVLQPEIHERWDFKTNLLIVYKEILVHYANGNNVVPLRTYPCLYCTRVVINCFDSYHIEIFLLVLRV